MNELGLNQGQHTMTYEQIVYEIKQITTIIELLTDKSPLSWLDPSDDPLIEPLILRRRKLVDFRTQRLADKKPAFVILKNRGEMFV